MEGGWTREQMRKILAIAVLVVMGCTFPSGPTPVQAEISEQFILTVNRQGSRVFLANRLQGGVVMIRTGLWTPLFSPGYGKNSNDTLLTVCRLWIQGAWDIDTPEESKLAAVELLGVKLPDTAIGPFPAPNERSWKIKTGVRTPMFGYPYVTTDTADVLDKFDDWLKGQWDIDRPNEPGFAKDSMYVGP
jgi:hypothetical protein